MPSHQSELQPFRCEVEPAPDGGVARVRPVGDLDFATVPLVDAELAELWSVGFTHLVLDLRGVPMIDSAGLRLLLTWHFHRWADGIAFSVIPGPPAVQQVMELSGVAKRLTYL